MTQIPIQKEVIDRIAAAKKIANPGKASIREMRKMIQDVESETGIGFVKMEMGIPGIPAAKVGIDAQIEALQNGVASVYPEIYGTADFKQEAARFVKRDSGLLCTYRWFNAGRFRQLLDTYPLRCKEKQSAVHRPGFPCTETTMPCFGHPHESFRCIRVSWRQIARKT